MPKQVTVNEKHIYWDQRKLYKALSNEQVISNYSCFGFYQYFCYIINGIMRRLITIERLKNINNGFFNNFNHSDTTF